VKYEMQDSAGEQQFIICRRSASTAQRRLLASGLCAMVCLAVATAAEIGRLRLIRVFHRQSHIGFSSWTSAQWLTDHEEPTRQGSRHRQNAPYQRMQTKAEP
jgi:hypothetical protein